MATFPDPVFFNTDYAAIVADTQAYYEKLVGRKLAPTQTETMLLQTFAYRETMARVEGNAAGKQNLLAFATYPMLDYLGAFLNVTRLAPGKALCSITFTMVTGHPTVVIPAGVRVQSTDGKVVFITLADVTAASGVGAVSVTAQATVEGAFGNGYQPGTINIILDPKAYVSAAGNSNITNGGTDQESDDNLRKRIKLAPSAFSTAGSEEAYEFFARSANSGIIDVKVISPSGALINIYPLMAGGVAPSSQVIGQVLAACNAQKVRPMNDIVSVLAPTAVNYAIDVTLTVLTDAIDQSVLDLVTKQLRDYIAERQTHLGIDVVMSQIIGKCSVDGVYECIVNSPSADVVINNNQFANNTGLTITIGGHSDA